MEFIKTILIRILYFPRFFFLSGYRYLWHHFVFTFGIFISIFILTLGLGLNRSIEHYFHKRFIKNLDINDILIQTRSPRKKQLPSFGLFSLQKIKPQGLSYHDYLKIKKIKGLKITGYTTDVYSPVTLRASFLGRGLKSEVVLTGATPSLVWKNLHSSHPFKVTNNVIPLLLPRYILDAYNSFAHINNLPVFRIKELRGFKIKLHIGESSFLPADEEKVRKFDAVIIGVSDIPNLHGLVIPSRLARKLNKEIAQIERLYFHSIFAKAEDAAKVVSISTALKKMGYRIESATTASKQARQALQVVDYILYVILFILLFFTGLSIFHGFFAILEKKKFELLMFRVFGASKMWILFFLSLQVISIAFLYGILGVWIAHESMAKLNSYILQWFPIIKSLSSQLFIPPKELYLKIALSAPLFALIVILIPALRISTIKLSQDMSA